jgi:hypothetical protein
MSVTRELEKGLPGDFAGWAEELVTAAVYPPRKNSAYFYAVCALFLPTCMDGLQVACLRFRFVTVNQWKCRLCDFDRYHRVSVMRKSGARTTHRSSPAASAASYSSTRRSSTRTVRPTRAWSFPLSLRRCVVSVKGLQ